MQIKTELGRSSTIGSVARLNLIVEEAARMGHSVIAMTRAVRRRLERVVCKSREMDYALRALAVLHLWETQGDVAEVAHRVRAARSSVYRWQSLYETYGEDGLRPQ